MLASCTTRVRNNPCVSRHIATGQANCALHPQGSPSRPSLPSSSRTRSRSSPTSAPFPTHRTPRPSRPLSSRPIHPSDRPTSRRACGTARRRSWSTQRRRWSRLRRESGRTRIARRGQAHLREVRRIGGASEGCWTSCWHWQRCALLRIPTLPFIDTSLSVGARSPRHRLRLPSRISTNVPLLLPPPSFPHPPHQHRPITQLAHQKVRALRSRSYRFRYVPGAAGAARRV